jgi:hypothetical protein
MKIRRIIPMLGERGRLARNRWRPADGFIKRATPRNGISKKAVAIVWYPSLKFFPRFVGRTDSKRQERGAKNANRLF